MGNLLQVFQLGAGRRVLIFPITFKRTFAGRCRIREQNRDFGIIPEREFILPQGIYYQNFRELSGKQICSDTERRARNPVEGIAREHRATTIPNEMRHVYR